MTPGRYNLTIYKGATFDISIRLRDGVTGYIDFREWPVIRMQIRPAWETYGYASDMPLCDLSLENGRLRLTEDGTVLTIHLSASETENLLFEEGFWDLELVKTESGEVWVDRLLEGNVEARRECTR